MFRCHFHQFIVVDEFDGLLEAHQARRNQAQGFVGARGPHVGLLLLAADVDVHVARTRVLANDHAFVDGHGGLDEHLAAILQIRDGIGRHRAGSVGDQGAGRARGNRTVPRLPAGEQVVHDAGAARLGEELRAEADQAARRDAELEPHAAAAVVHHLGHDALADARFGDDHALEVLGDVDDEFLDRLGQHAVDVLRDDLGPRHLQFVPFAAHHLDQDRQLQFTAADDLHLLRRVGRLHTNRDVAEQFLVEPVLHLT